MTRRFARWWIGVALQAAGCAVYTSGIRPDATVDPKSAYLYGQFFMKADADDESFGGKPSMGLVIGCENGSSYTFGSRDKHEIQVLRVKPSRCWLIRAVLADQNGMVRKQLPADRSVQRPLDFAAGRAYYLGDYFAKGDYWIHQGGAVAVQHWEWAMSSAAIDRYLSTTVEMKRIFPNLAALPDVDMRLIAEPPRKKGNGIGASPEEPPMSPQRVARIAPFINRSYRTPAQCEAACAAGQCLPYRGDGGPAMACVIRCDRDADCPQGLACNCPDSERAAGPDCHLIAAAPKDAMARICLSAGTAGQSPASPAAASSP